VSIVFSRIIYHIIMNPQGPPDSGSGTISISRADSRSYFTQRASRTVARTSVIEQVSDQKQKQNKEQKIEQNNPGSIEMKEVSSAE